MGERGNQNIEKGENSLLVARISGRGRVKYETGVRELGRTAVASNGR